MAKENPYRDRGIELFTKAMHRESLKSTDLYDLLQACGYVARKATERSEDPVAIVLVREAQNLLRAAMEVIIEE